MGDRVTCFVCSSCSCIYCLSMFVCFSCSCIYYIFMFVWLSYSCLYYVSMFVHGCEFVHIQGLGVRTPARPTFFPTFDKSHCDQRYSSSTNGLTVYVEKQPIDRKWEYCVEYLCKKARKHMSMWTSRRDTTEHILKVENDVKPQSINISLILWHVQLNQNKQACSF